MSPRRLPRRRTLGERIVPYLLQRLVRSQRFAFYGKEGFSWDPSAILAEVQDTCESRGSRRARLSLARRFGHNHGRTSERPSYIEVVFHVVSSNNALSIGRGTSVEVSCTRSGKTQRTSVQIDPSYKKTWLALLSTIEDFRGSLHGTRGFCHVD